MSGETREIILEAALEVFAGVGFKGATARAIAARAEVNLALVNYHFGSKEKLWSAVCERCGTWVLEVVGRSVRDPSPAQILDDVLGGLFDALVEDPRPVRIMNWAVLQADALESFDDTAMSFKPFVDLVHGFVEPLQQEGFFADTDIKLVLSQIEAMIVWAFVDQPGHRWAYGKDFSDPEYAERTKKQLLQSARCLLRGEGP